MKAILIFPVMTVVAGMSSRSYGVGEILSSPLFGDKVVPEYEENAQQDLLPGDNVLPHLDMRQDPLLQTVLSKADKKLVEMLQEHNAKTEPAGTTVETHPEPDRVVPDTSASSPASSGSGRRSVNRGRVQAPPPVNINPAQPPSPFAGRNAQVFHRNLTFATRLKRVPTVNIPSNSVALATVVAGVKVRNSRKMRMPIRLDYAFLGPNKAVVEMTGCEAFVNVASDIHVSRIYGEIGNLSCKAPDGETMNIPFQAHLIDNQDNFVGVEGTTVLNGKMEAGLMAFLSDATSAFGKAMAAAQVTTQVQTTQDGPGISGSNVTGDKNKYIAGQTISGATGRFLNWWVDFYQGLQPTVEVASGRKIFFMTDGEHEVPKVFFGKTVSDSAIKRVNTSKSLMMRGEMQ